MRLTKRIIPCSREHFSPRFLQTVAANSNLLRRDGWLGFVLLLSSLSLHSCLWSGQRDPANTTALTKHSGLGRLCSDSISKSAFLGAPAWRQTHPPHFSPKAMSADFNLSRPREANSCRGRREKRRITAGYIFVRLEKYGRIKNFLSIFKTTQNGCHCVSKKMRSRFDILFTGDLNLLALCAF